MTERNVRSVSEEERVLLAAQDLINATEVLETLRVAIKDGITLNPDEAISQIEEAKGSIQHVYSELMIQGFIRGNLEDEFAGWHLAIGQPLVRLAPDSVDEN